MIASGGISELDGNTFAEVIALAVLSSICSAEGDAAITPNAVVRASRNTKTCLGCFNAIVVMICVFILNN